MQRLKLELALCELLPDIDRRMQEHGVETYYIAGGYLRDMLLGNDPKDIDIFVPAEYAGNIHLAGGSTFDKPPEEYIDQEVVSVCTLELRTTDLPLEVIVLGPGAGTTPEAIMDRFDTNICKVVCDHDGNITISEEFEQDVANKTITINRCNGATTERLQGRIDRLTAKFPEYTVEDPNGFLVDIYALCTL